MSSLNLSSPKSNHKKNSTDWREILDSNHQELVQIAAQMRIDWNKAKPHVYFNDIDWNNGKNIALDEYAQEDNGRCSVLSYVTKKNGYNKFVVMFSNRGLGSMPFVFDDEHNTVSVSSLKNIRINQDQTTSNDVDAIKAKEGKRVLAKFLEEWNNAPVELPADKFYYFVKKDVVDYVPSLKLMHDYNGAFAPIPLQNIEGEIVSFQKIYADDNTNKMMLKSCQTKEAFHLLGDLENPKNNKIYVVEGYATGLSILKLLKGQCTVVVAFSASNLAPVVCSILNVHPALKKAIKIIADNDVKHENLKGNTGILAALKAAKIRNLSLIYPTFPNGATGSDFNDLMILDRDLALKQLTEKAFLYSVKRDALPYQRQLVDFGPQITIHNAKKSLEKYINCGITKCIDEKAIVEGLNGCKKSQLSDEKILQLVKNKKYGRENYKRSLHTISEGYDKIVTVNVLTKDQFGRSIINRELVNKLIMEWNGNVIANLPMACGKTEFLIRDAIHHPSVQMAKLLSHRIAIVSDVCKRIGIMNYQDMGMDEGFYVQKFGSCINSADAKRFGYGEAFFYNDIIIIDEGTKVLKHLCGGTIENRKKEHMTNILFRSIRTAKKTIIADADADQSTIDILRLADPDKRILVLQAGQEIKKQDVDFIPAEAGYMKVLRLLSEGKNVFVPCDTKKGSLALIEKAKEENPDLKVLFLSADTKDYPNVKKFLNSPNTECLNYNLLIYTSSCDSALSITVDHFHEIIGIFKGIVDPLELIQMMGRLRTAKKWTVGFTLQRHREWHQSKREILDRIAPYYKNNSISDYDNLACIIDKKDQDLRIDYRFALLTILDQKNHKVAVLEQDEAFLKASRKEISDRTKSLKKKYIDKIHKAPLITEYEANDLKKQSFNTSEDNAKLFKFEIAKMFCRKEITQEDIIFYISNKNAVGVAETALTDCLDKCIDFDEKDSKFSGGIENLMNLKFKKNLFMILFECLGFDLKDGKSVEYSYADAKRVLKHVLSFDGDNTALFNKLKIGPQVDKANPPKDAMKFVNHIFRKMGLAPIRKLIGKKRTSVYYICPKSLERILTILKARAEAKRHVADWNPDGSFDEVKALKNLKLAAEWKKKPPQECLVAA